MGEYILKIKSLMLIHIHTDHIVNLMTRDRPILLNRFSHFKPCRYRFSTINIKPIPIFQEIQINIDFGR